MRRKTASTWFQAILVDAHKALASPRSERLALLLISFLLWGLTVLEVAAQQQR